MNFTETSQYLEYNTSLLFTPNRKGFKKLLLSLSNDEKEHIKTEISNHYFKLGWGIKIIARNVLGISYTKCRIAFDVFGLEFNKGYDICNDFLRKFRKNKSIIENASSIGFNDPSIDRYAKSMSRGVQGYYYNNSTDSYVWLRSTWEFIYAKFLNKLGVNWKTEQKYFQLSDGTRYSPDFYVYDSNWSLEKIVEIKGYFDNRAYKVDLLREEFYKESNIDIVMIRDITLYLESGLTYGKELETWKILRKSKEFISQESN